MGLEIGIKQIDSTRSAAVNIDIWRGGGEGVETSEPWLDMHGGVGEVTWQTDLWSTWIHS